MMTALQVVQVFDYSCSTVFKKFQSCILQTNKNQLKLWIDLKLEKKRKKEGFYLYKCSHFKWVLLNYQILRPVLWRGLKSSFKVQLIIHVVSLLAVKNNVKVIFEFIYSSFLLFKGRTKGIWGNIRNAFFLRSWRACVVSSGTEE